VRRFRRPYIALTGLLYWQHFQSWAHAPGYFTSPLRGSGPHTPNTLHAFPLPSRVPLPPFLEGNGIPRCMGCPENEHTEVPPTLRKRETWNLERGTRYSKSSAPTRYAIGDFPGTRWRSLPGWSTRRPRVLWRTPETPEVRACGRAGRLHGDAEEQMSLPRRGRSRPKARKKHEQAPSSLDQVLSMPNRELGRVLCVILEECPNYTSKKDDLTKRVCKYFDFITRGAPRKQLKKKIGWAVSHLRKAGKVEEYKAKNIRVRLLNPTQQGRLM